MVQFQIADPRPQLPMDGAPFHLWELPEGTPWIQFHRLEDGYLLRFPELADFHISSDGTFVICWPAAEVSHETIQHLYLNQVWPLALSRCGKLVFHASAVAIDGAATAFMGSSGQGKSTLAAEFATHGFPFLTDDGLRVESQGGSLQILPSHPSIRLWEDSQDALLRSGVEAAPSVQYTSKSRFLAGGDIAFCDQPKPLRRVFFLGDGTAEVPQFHRLRPGEALIELVKHSFLLDIEEKEMLATHFNELANMVNEPIYYRLDYPRRYEDLAQVRQAIIEHMRNTGDPS